MKVGDTVYLNSGSPPFTVQSIKDGQSTCSGMEEMTCSWMVGGTWECMQLPTVCFTHTVTPVDDMAKIIRKLSGKNAGYQLKTSDWNLLTEAVAQLLEVVGHGRQLSDTPVDDTPPA